MLGGIVALTVALLLATALVALGRDIERLEAYLQTPWRQANRLGQ